MEPGAPLLLAAYGVGIAAASLFGGWLPTVFEATHVRIQLVMAFVAGLILGVAVFHMLPHSLHALSVPIAAGSEFASDPGWAPPGLYAPFSPPAAEVAVGWIMAGMVLTLLLLYLFDFHEHDFSEEHSQQHDRGNGCSITVSPVTWSGIMLGLGIHSLTEGLTLSSTMRLADPGEVTAASLGVFLAIALHKPLDALSIVSTMRANHFNPSLIPLFNLGFALLCPLAAVAAYWGISQFGPAESYVIGCALAFATGSFLCFALSDLMPEIHFHSHDRIKLALCFLAGIGIAYALHWVEPAALHGLDAPH